MSGKVERFVERYRFVAVVRAQSGEVALNAALAARRGGARIIEVTFTVPQAGEVIARLRRQAPEVLIGAGTVLSPAQAEEAVRCGVEFIVSPIVEAEVVEWCRERGVYVVPGASTPTEVSRALRLGVHLVKIFPADVLGGPAYVRALRGPFPELRVLPTGGVDLHNVADYFRAGATAVGVGGALFPEEALLKGDYARIEELAGRFSLACEAVPPAGGPPSASADEGAR